MDVRLGACKHLLKSVSAVVLKLDPDRELEASEGRAGNLGGWKGEETRAHLNSVALM